MSLVVSHKFQARLCQGCPPEADNRRAPIDRRRLIAMLGIGAAGIGAGTTLPGRMAFAAGAAEALLLNCIDYRLTGATTRYMAEEGMKGKYDQFILAGAALGVQNAKFPDWGKPFWEPLSALQGREGGARRAATGG